MHDRYTIQTALTSDEPILWKMLFYAAHMDEDADATIDDAKKHDTLVQYVREWGRDGDLGYIAWEVTSNSPTGAVWARIFPPKEGYSTVNEGTPELAIAVLPEYIGQGIGTRLMRRLLTDAAELYPAVALNVRADNPALRLYKRLGFRIVREMTNRVGTLSYDMLCDL